LKLAVLFGGASYEHEISIVSAVTMKEKLTRFELTFVFCDQDHRFYRIDPEKMMAKSFASGDYRKMPEVHLTLGGFERRKMLGSERIEMPVLNLIHGGDGEDGTIASMLDFYKIDYIGPRPAASQLSYDKRYTKWLADSLGVKTVPYEVLCRGEVRELETAFPCIVKPARLGSSIGVSVVRSDDALDYALDVAFEFDDCVIVEPFIDGVREYNLAGCMIDGELRFSIVEEPQKSEFLDFDKKYLDFSRTGAVTEAPLEDAEAMALKAAFKRIYTNLFEGALIRCDFFMVDGEVMLNEINPIPGSMANYLFDDFEGVIGDLLRHLPEKRMPRVDYRYIHSINAAKGK
jgi:D-alanine-D-alanine ligase